MRKLLLGFAGLLLSGTMMAQAVSDNAVIPIGVTLNPILRINVVYGGNIQFVVNTIDQYKTGISNNTGSTTDFYDTHFEVSSSVDYQVQMRAETQLMGVDHGSSINLSYLGYYIEENGAYNTSCYLTLEPTGVETPRVLDVNAFTIVTENVGGYGYNGGDADDNSFVIHWEFATSSVISIATNGFNDPLATSELIKNSYVPDYYATNIFLELSPIVAW